MRHHASTKRLFESAGEETIASSAEMHARRLLAVYLLLTLGGGLLVWAVHGDIFVATIHTLAAISTGGFSGFDDSLAGMTVLARMLLEAGHEVVFIEKDRDIMNPEAVLPFRGRCPP